MKLTARMMVGLACLALVAAACGKKDKEKQKPAPKTTAPSKPDKAPEPKANTTADHVKALDAGWAAFNKGDMEAFAGLYTDDVTLDIVDSGNPPAQGKEATLATINVFRSAFPDLKGERHLGFANGNTIVTIDLMHGTHTGELMGMKPTNKKVGFLVAHVHEMSPDSKVKKELAYFDAGTMMGQLGAHEMPHRAAMTPTGNNAPVIIAANDDKEKANLDVATQILKLYTDHKIDEAMAFATDDFTVTDMSAPMDVSDKAMMKQMVEMWIKAMPDGKFATEFEFAAGDYVVRGGSWSGTNTGPMPAMGLKKATNKKLTMRMLEVILFEEGKAKQSWGFANGMAMATQLGLMPPPASK